MLQDRASAIRHTDAKSCHRVHLYAAICTAGRSFSIEKFDELAASCSSPAGMSSMSGLSRSTGWRFNWAVYARFQRTYLPLFVICSRSGLSGQIRALAIRNAHIDSEKRIIEDDHASQPGRTTAGTIAELCVPGNARMLPTGDMSLMVASARECWKQTDTVKHRHGVFPSFVQSRHHGRYAP